MYYIYIYIGQYLWLAGINEWLSRELTSSASPTGISRESRFQHPSLTPPRGFLSAPIHLIPRNPQICFLHKSAPARSLPQWQRAGNNMNYPPQTLIISVHKPCDTKPSGLDTQMLGKSCTSETRGWGLAAAFSTIVILLFFWFWLFGFCFSFSSGAVLNFRWISSCAHWGNWQEF